MASLNRVTGKVFAGEADLENIGIFGSAKAGTPTNNTDVATIQSLSAYLAGWTAGVVTSKNFPPVEEVNGALKTISYQACYCLQEGIAEWDANTEYKANSYCKVNDTIYCSKQNNNKNHSVTDTAWWESLYLRLNGGTMTGNLAVNKSYPVIELRNADEVAGTTPSDQLNKAIRFGDSNGTTVGYIQNQYQTNGSRYTIINCRNADGSDNASIAIGYGSDGVARSTTVDPPDSSNSNNIATTSFVRKWAYGKVVGKNYFIIDTNSSVPVNGSNIGYNLGTQPSSGNPYLPSDYSVYPYEVLVTIEGITGTTVGDYMNIAFESALVGALDCAKAKCVVSGRADLCSWTGWIPISNGALWLVRSTEWTGSIVKLVVRGYRRLN